MRRFGQFLYILVLFLNSVLGGLAQLARALAWHARGHRFDPDILHGALDDIKKCSAAQEIFDMLTHKTVSKDFMIK